MTVTAREIEILLVTAEYGIKGAAGELGVNEQTIKNSLSTTYRKLGARGMAHAILILSRRQA